MFPYDLIKGKKVCSNSAIINLSTLFVSLPYYHFAFYMFLPQKTKNTDGTCELFVQIEDRYLIMILQFCIMKIEFNPIMNLYKKRKNISNDMDRFSDKNA